MDFLTKNEIAARFSVTPNTVGIWVRNGLLPPPFKMGSRQQSRVRWPADAVVQLERNLRDRVA